MTGSFHLRPSSAEDLPGIVRLQQGSEPLHPWSLEELVRDLETLESHLQHHFRVAVRNGALAGMSDLQRPAGSYHPHRFHLQLCVDPGVRGQGIGSALYDAVLQDLATQDPMSLTVQVRESAPQALRFAQVRGFQELKRDFESLLPLASFDFEAHGEPEARLQRDGLAFRTFRELDGPEFRLRFHEAFETVRADVPRADPPTPLTFAFFERNVLEDPGLLPDAFVFALDGATIQGFTGGYAGAHPGTMDTWLTGVLRQARGRGIATALKVRSLRNAVDLGFTTVRTDNDTRNVPMLVVNDRLGFQRQPALILLRRVFRTP